MYYFFAAKNIYKLRLAPCYQIRPCRHVREDVFRMMPGGYQLAQDQSLASQLDA